MSKDDDDYISDSQSMISRRTNNNNKRARGRTQKMESETLYEELEQDLSGTPDPLKYETILEEQDDEDKLNMEGENKGGKEKQAYYGPKAIQ